MNANFFIIDELEKFIKDFSKVRVRYEHSEMSRSHFIEIVPNAIFHSDNDLKEWEYNFWDKFVSLYPTESICFISDDALVGIENDMYIKEGLDYAPFSTNDESFTFDPNLLLLQQNILQNVDNITFNEDKVYNPIEKIEVTKEYVSVCQIYSLAA